MIKRIKNSLTIKICTLIAVLLAVSSGITYAVIVGFLPTYYSKQLQKDIDSVSQEMIETIHSYETINEASYAIELFEAGSKVSVVILDEQGNRIWPAESTAVTEDVLDNGGVVGLRCGLGSDGGRPCLCAGKRLCPARYRGAQRQCPRHPAV